MTCPHCGKPLTSARGALTPKMRQAYDAVAEFIVKMGYQPSLMQIQQMLQLNARSEAGRLLGSLEQRGWLKRGVGIVLVRENSP
jgi:SOS-response transcriptional repressor LexA